MTTGKDILKLIRSLSSENKCFEAATALVSFGGSAVEPLIEALKTDNWKIRGNAAWTLGKIEDPRAIEPLIVTLKDNVPEVRVMAARALINMGDASVEPLLRSLDRCDQKLKNMIILVLSCIGEESVEELQKSRQCARAL